MTLGLVLAKRSPHLLCQQHFLQQARAVYVGSVPHSLLKEQRLAARTVGVSVPGMDLRTRKAPSLPRMLVEPFVDIGEVARDVNQLVLMEGGMVRVGVAGGRVVQDWGAEDAP